MTVQFTFIFNVWGDGVLIDEYACWNNQNQHGSESLGINSVNLQTQNK